MCVYSVTGKNSVNETGEESHGLLCFAEIEEFSGKLDSEIEKVELMDELPENWTYPLIQPILLEKFWQMEKQSYTKIQLAAKKTIEYIQSIIKPGMNLLEIRRLCEDKLLELGADSFWYWDVGAFVFAGDETTVSVSGKQYVTSDRVIDNNDILTIDLIPQIGNIWGDYARTIILENGKVVDDIELIQNQEWKSGLQIEEKLHAELLTFVTKETTFEELYYYMNEFILKNGFVNLDFMGNLGHSIVKVSLIGGIEINVMNDAVMFVQCTGSDGTVAEWDMDLKPTEIGDDGEYIYYYGKGIKMSYYPSDHHIHVDGENNYFGDYYPNDNEIGLQNCGSCRERQLFSFV